MEKEKDIDKASFTFYSSIDFFIATHLCKMMALWTGQESLSKIDEPYEGRRRASGAPFTRFGPEICFLI